MSHERNLWMSRNLYFRDRSVTALHSEAPIPDTADFAAIEHNLPDFSRNLERFRGKKAQ